MITYINQIEIDHSTEMPRVKEFQVTTEPVQSSEHQDVTRYVKSVLSEFTLDCNFTGDDREERFVQLLRLSEEKRDVEVVQDERFENLIITSIIETGRYLNIVSFSISFKQINIITFESVPEIKEAEIQTIQEETEEGLQQLTEEDVAEEYLNTYYPTDFDF